MSFFCNRNNSSKISIAYLPFIGLFALIVWSLFRIFLSTALIINEVNVLDVLKALFSGLWFDLATISYIASLFLFVSICVPNRLRQSVIFKRLLWSLLFITIFLLIFELISEFIFWQEFSTRFNFIAVDYLIYTNEVIGNISESYPVALILFAIALTAGLLVYGVKQYIEFKVDYLTWRKRLKLAIFAVAFPRVGIYLVNIYQATEIN